MHVVTFLILDVLFCLAILLFKLGHHSAGISTMEHALTFDLSTSDKAKYEGKLQIMKQKYSKEQREDTKENTKQITNVNVNTNTTNNKQQSPVNTPVKTKVVVTPPRNSPQTIRDLTKSPAFNTPTRSPQTLQPSTPPRNVTSSPKITGSPSTHVHDYSLFPLITYDSVRDYCGLESRAMGEEFFEVTYSVKQSTIIITMI